MISRKTQTKIKMYLINHDLTQVDIAKKLGVSRQQLNGVINGRVENLNLELEVMKLLGFYKK